MANIGMKKLTTVIPVYNNERFLAKTLDSLARQTRRPDRLVLVDDGSKDGTSQVIARFPEMPYELHPNAKNLGLFGNFNRTLDFAAETEFLHVLHADDILKPEFYARCLGELENVSGRAMIYCQAELIDQNDQLLPKRPAAVPARRRVIPKREFIAAQCRLREFYWPCVLLRTDGRPVPCKFPMDLSQLGDQVFWAEWSMHCEAIIALPEVLCQYRMHAGSGTQNNQANLQAWVADEWRAMQRIASLLGETGIRRWLRLQMLKCLFAARSHVKINCVPETSPELANRIRQITREAVNPGHWMLGGMALWLRDTLQPSKRFRPLVFHDSGVVQPGGAAVPKAPAV
jgi:glycosyl transferase family 2